MKVHRPNCGYRLRAGGSSKTYAADAALAGKGFDSDGYKKKAGIYGLDFLVPEKKDSKGDWRYHSLFAEDPRPQSLDIEIVSNLPEFTLQVHRGAYNSGKPFCSRPHCINDTKGVAQRLAPNGGIFVTECDPEKCTLAQNARDGALAAEIYNRWNKVYPVTPPLATMDKQGEKTVFKAVKCEPLINLVFALVSPENPDDYAHPLDDVCVFFTHSIVMRDRFRDALSMLWVRCHGEIAGMRLRLTYSPIATGHSKAKKDGWDLELPPEHDLERRRIEARDRRQLQRINYDELPASVSSKALMLVNEERNLTEWVAASYPEAMQQALDDKVRADNLEYERLDPANYTLVSQDAVIQQLIKRLGTSYAMETRLNADFTDVYKAVEWFRENKKPGDYIDDILYSYYSSLPGRHPYIVEMDRQHAAPDELAWEAPEAPPAAAEEKPKVFGPTDMEAAVRGEAGANDAEDAEFEEVDDEPVAPGMPDGFDDFLRQRKEDAEALSGEDPDQ